MQHVGLPVIPTYRRSKALPPTKPSGWVVRTPRSATPGGGTLVHEAPCRRAVGEGRETGALEALDALMRPGAKACHDCAATEVLLPAMELGQGYG
ncbi:hypothetical protein GCM10010211_20300 [Streptomyces albospinus]|uniref:Uncharacterized protein n=1 Tax=Streptomyces albospinus TaxID=285515 RepID=A0ABQ2UY43_9ACTN|nr:hypothetical protein GCM10010211_20300 [Streptomyces albospinus]